MSDQQRDWDRELADIDRLVAKQTGAPAGGTAPAPAARPAPLGPVPARRHVALTWFWVALALALSLALVIWPYQRACGLQLFFYLGAVGVTGLAGLLGALASWSHRRGRPVPACSGHCPGWGRCWMPRRRRRCQDHYSR